MIVKNLNRIDELEEEIKLIKSAINSNKKYDGQILSKVLFRGQSNHKWSLETTLERYSKNKQYTISDYNRLLMAIKPAINSFTKENLIIEKDDNYRENDFLTTPPSYQTMSYVRHLGFPSPLLDWTQSLYVALFFAFQNCEENQHVSVFAYISTLGSGKSGWVGAAKIEELGPYIDTHKRHHSQQSQYTISVKKESDDWIYCPHDEGFQISGNDRQNILYKFTLPTELKFEVLQKLQEMNINAFSLFHNEESLMKYLAFKEINIQ